MLEPLHTQFTVFACFFCTFCTPTLLLLSTWLPRLPILPLFFFENCSSLVFEPQAFACHWSSPPTSCKCTAYLKFYVTPSRSSCISLTDHAALLALSLSAPTVACSSAATCAFTWLTSNCFACPDNFSLSLSACDICSIRLHVGYCLMCKSLAPPS